MASYHLIISSSHSSQVYVVFQFHSLVVPSVYCDALLRCDTTAL